MRAGTWRRSQALRPVRGIGVEKTANRRAKVIELVAVAISHLALQHVDELEPGMLEHRKHLRFLGHGDQVRLHDDGLADGMAQQAGTGGRPGCRGVRWSGPRRRGHGWPRAVPRTYGRTRSPARSAPRTAVAAWPATARSDRFRSSTAYRRTGRPVGQIDHGHVHAGAELAHLRPMANSRLFSANCPVIGVRAGFVRPARQRGRVGGGGHTRLPGGGGRQSRDGRARSHETGYMRTVMGVWCGDAALVRLGPAPTHERPISRKRSRNFLSGNSFHCCDRRRMVRPPPFLC